MDSHAYTIKMSPSLNSTQPSSVRTVTADELSLMTRRVNSLSDEASKLVGDISLNHLDEFSSNVDSLRDEHSAIEPSPEDSNILLPDLDCSRLLTNLRQDFHAMRISQLKLVSKQFKDIEGDILSGFSICNYSDDIKTLADIAHRLLPLTGEGNAWFDVAVSDMHINVTIWCRLCLIMIGVRNAQDWDTRLRPAMKENKAIFEADWQKWNRTSAIYHTFLFD
jgi:hypothetical protein